MTKQSKSLAAPRGTRDIYGVQMRKWRRFEDMIREITDCFGYGEIRTPMFEHTELFVRGVGDGTDIVTKEMYTFNDKGGRSITLKPETTAGAARAYIEHSIYAETQPSKFFYISPTFRYEKPEAGRYRQHYQFGIEAFGSYNSACDAEVISVAYTLIKRLGLNNVVLHLNSIGCKTCREKYNGVLMSFLEANLDKLCGTCNERVKRNPMRVLDCKNELCKKTLFGAPTPIEYISDECGNGCKSHFNTLLNLLISMKIPFVIDKRIVRGLDYYTKTVFEFISNDIGSQGTVCAGGRYDNLIAECGGPATGAVGFGMGMDRIMLLAAEQGEEPRCDCFIGHMGERGQLKAQTMTFDLRSKGYFVESDIVGRSVKAQLKYADKLNARYSCIIGDDEIDGNTVKLKDMVNGGSKEINLNAIIENL